MLVPETTKQTIKGSRELQSWKEGTNKPSSLLSTLRSREDIVCLFCRLLRNDNDLRSKWLVAVLLWSPNWPNCTCFHTYVKLGLTNTNRSRCVFLVLTCERLDDSIFNKYNGEMIHYSDFVPKQIISVTKICYKNEN